MTQGQDETLTLEQSSRLVEIALQGYCNGMLTALANMGVPMGDAVPAAVSVVRSMYADPLIRNKMAETSERIWRGEKHECDHDDPVDPCGVTGIKLEITHGPLAGEG